jgi:NADH:ubiquinone oxidoreductase subunit 3 (subunit A)
VPYLAALAVLVLAVLAVAVLHALHLAVALDRDPLQVLPYASGGHPREHAWSRFHARWYVAAMVFLAFDIEMLFMYPWAAVLPDMTTGAVVEMFGFLGVIMAAVVYAWREGAFRWS